LYIVSADLTCLFLFCSYLPYWKL